MSYDEVINNLESAVRRYKDATHHVSCIVNINILKDTLDLINRQKEEIERLKQENEFCHKTITKNAQRALEVTVEEIEKTKFATMKEFAEKIKKEITPTIMALFSIGEILVDVSKSHISQNDAFDEIRNKLQESNIIYSRLKLEQMIEDIVKEMDDNNEIYS